MKYGWISTRTRLDLPLIFVLTIRLSGSNALCGGRCVYSQPYIQTNQIGHMIIITKYVIATAKVKYGLYIQRAVVQSTAQIDKGRHTFALPKAKDKISKCINAIWQDNVEMWTFCCHFMSGMLHLAVQSWLHLAYLSTVFCVTVECTSLASKQVYQFVRKLLFSWTQFNVHRLLTVWCVKWMSFYFVAAPSIAAREGLKKWMCFFEH